MAPFRLFWRAAILAAVVLPVYSGDQVRAAGDATASNYVRLALQHGAHGKAEFRRQLLEAAVLVSPDYAPAHWHLGHVKVDGEWMPAEQAGQRNSSCEALATYDELRDKALRDPRRELALARWCKSQGWDDRSELHLARVALDRQADRYSRNEALRDLDLVRVAGHLLLESELDQWQERTKDVENAFKKWRRPLVKWRNAIEIAGGDQAEHATQELAEIDDPAIVPVVESFLDESGGRFGEQLIAVLAGLPQHEATEALVHFAVRSPWQNVRDQASEELRQRPLHDYVPMLLDALVAPTQTRFLITRSPDGVIRYQHVVYRRNADGNYVAIRERLTQPLFRGRNDGTTPLEAQIENQIRVRFHTRRAALEATALEDSLIDSNLVVHRNNAPIFNVLRVTTGERLGADPAEWQEWWENFNETYNEKPTYYGVCSNITGG